MGQHFNHASIRRQAHGLSRKNSDQAWNPFRHVSWDRPKASDLERGRHGSTWPANSPSTDEAGAAAAEYEGKPNLRHYPSDPGRRVPNDPSNADTLVGGASPPTIPEEGHDEMPGAAGVNGGPVLRERNTATTASSRQMEDEKPPQTPDDNGKQKKKGTGLLRHVQPKQPFTVVNQLQRTLLGSWINILILAAPAGIAMAHTGVNGIAVFVVNFIAIIPLAAMLSFSTEEVALRTGETLGGLLNATFGNAVELIVAILALAEDKVLIVQTSLIGSILSNLLLVLGFCFFFGGLRREEQHFNTTVAQTAASLLSLAVASTIVPTVFDEWTGNQSEQVDVARISRGVSIILLVVYGAYLFFQLKTHSAVFAAESKKVEAKPWRKGKPNGKGNHPGEDGISSAIISSTGVPFNDKGERERLSKQMQHHSEEDDDHEEPQLHFLVALGTLAGSTAVIAICAEAMVTSIDAVTQEGGVSAEFVGLILLPIVGNAAEHATAVSVACKDKMDLAIGVAVGSSMQVALFLIPLLVVIGWGMGNDQMDLSFDLFQVAVLFVAVLLTNYLIADGKSHWLEGLQLICLYAIIAVCSWFYPAPSEEAAG